MLSLFRPFSTSRNSHEILRQWRHELPFDLTNQIQNKCQTVMNTLGYELASGPNTLTNTSTSLLLQQEQLQKDWIKDFMLHV